MQAWVYRAWHISGSARQLVAQSVGVLANFLWVFPVALASFWIIDKTIGNRVPARAEVEGLDIPEMGVLGYINEDTRAVQVAGEAHLSTFGPGVPSTLHVDSARDVPAGRR